MSSSNWKIWSRNCSREWSLTKWSLQNLKKNTTYEARKASEKKEKRKGKLNSNEDLSDLNIMKYFYLNMTGSINVSEISYISSFKTETELKQCFLISIQLFAAFNIVCKNIVVIHHVWI